MRARLTTAEAAAAVGIGRVTLQKWIRSGRVKAPEVTLLNGHAVRFWSQPDIRTLRWIKEKTYRRGRGRKKKAKK
jgi:excisionase family DNA binding protein